MPAVLPASNSAGRSIARAACLCASLLALTAIGCSDRPKRVPVSGKVLIDGQPLTRGFVRLVPPDARPATGKIGADGTFELGCYEDDDGCVPGTHVVTVTAIEPINAGSQRWHTPKKYTTAATSGLTATIDGPTDSLTIELSWEGGKPFVETFGSEGTQP